MKWEIEPTRPRPRMQWHQWWAWYPVRVYDVSPSQWVWFERVWRQRVTTMLGKRWDYTLEDPR